MHTCSHRQNANLPTAVVEFVTERPGLDELRAVWRTAATAAGNAFITPEWFFAWLQVNAAAKPVVAVARRSGAIRGLLPLVLEDGTLRFAGARFGDRFHPVLAEPSASDRSEVLSKLFRGVFESRSARTLGVLQRVDVDVVDLWRDVSRTAGLRASTHRYEVLPFIPVDGHSWPDYLRGISRNLRSQATRRESALSGRHALEYICVREAAAVHAFLETFFDLHERRWATESTLASPLARAFHRQFATAAAEQGWLRGWLLAVDQVPVGSWYGWSIGGRYSYYQAGFDPTWSRYSPGTLLLLRTIHAAFEEGASEYDLLLGDEAYKRKLASDARQVATLVAAPGLSRRYALAAAEAFARDRLQRLPEGMSAAARLAAKRLRAKLR